MFSSREITDFSDPCIRCRATTWPSISSTFMSVNRNGSGMSKNFIEISEVNVLGSVGLSFDLYRFIIRTIRTGLGMYVVGFARKISCSTSNIAQTVFCVDAVALSWVFKWIASYCKSLSAHSIRIFLLNCGL